MFDYFDAYLDTVVSPERKRLILRACQALVDSGKTEWVDQIQVEMAVAENRDANFVNDWVDGFLVPLYRVTLLEFGVTLADNVPLVAVVDIFEALCTIDNYDDASTISDYVNSEEGNVEMLADVLQLVGSKTADDYLSHLATVSDALIDRIRTLTQTASDEQVESDIDPLMVLQARVRLQKLFASVDQAWAAGTLITAYINAEGRLGLPAQDIIQPYLDQLESVDAPHLVFALAGFALASDLSEAAVHPQIKQWYDQLHVDALKRTKLDAATVTLLKKVFA